MKAKIFLLLTFMSSIFFGALKLQAQQDTIVKKSESLTGFWIEAGGGWGGQGAAFGVSMQIQITDGALVTLNYDATKYEGDRNFSWSNLQVQNGIDTKSFSVQLGKIKKFKGGMLVCSAGISWVNIKDYEYSTISHTVPCVGLPSSNCTSYENVQTLDEANTAGLPLEVELIFHTRHIGFGINPFLNINPKHIYGGLVLNFALGGLKSN